MIADGHDAILPAYILEGASLLGQSLASTSSQPASNHWLIDTRDKE
jgi:hypothetical protein